MELEKIRNLTDDELPAQQSKSAEQLFRLRFQKSLGNNEGVKKLRALKLDIARIQTVTRERALAAEKAASPAAVRTAPAVEHTHRPQESEEGLTMADTINTAVPEAQVSRRNEKVGMVVSTKMQKTIVVEIEMRKAHPKYKRVMKSNKKFYAHDELNSARVGDVVRIREARPLSKLKRWSLEEIVRRSSLSQLDEKDSVAEAK